MNSWDDEYDYDIEVDDLGPLDWEMMPMEPPDDQYDNTIYPDDYEYSEDVYWEMDHGDYEPSKDDLSYGEFANKVKLQELIEERVDEEILFPFSNSIDEDFQNFISGLIENNTLQHFSNFDSAINSAKKSARETGKTFYIYNYASKELFDPILNIKDGTYVSPIHIPNGLNHS